LVEEFTQTRPGPPPGAAVLLETEDLAEVLAAELAAGGVDAAGAADGAGVGAETGVVVAAAAGVASAANQVSTP